jgi:hypothetical protein
MSWRATAFVKNLQRHPDGSLLTAREKLVLFVLADYHSDHRDCAWAGMTALAKAALTSPRHLCRVLADLERKGSLKITRRDMNSNEYRFPELPRDPVSPPQTKTTRRGSDTMSGGVLTQLRQGGTDIAMSPKPSVNRQEPTPPTPPPPAEAGEQTFRWGLETLAVRMGRKRRLPNLSSFDGAHADQVVKFLRGRGFEARVVEGNR